MLVIDAVLKLKVRVLYQYLHIENDRVLTLYGTILANDRINVLKQIYKYYENKQTYYNDINAIVITYITVNI